MRTTWAARTALCGGAVSLLVTGVWMAVGSRSEPHAGTLVLWLLEAGVLLVLIVLAVRSAGPRLATAGALVAGLALGLSLLRFGPLTPVMAYACGAWAAGAAVAALIGAYLRALDSGRHRAVEQARLQQRLELASDLHDFVAHDVSEILAQAQAAQVLAVSEPARLHVALERITTSAVRALDTLDRIVHGVLDQGPDTDGTPSAAAGLMDDIALLVERFRLPGTVRVQLQVQDEALAAVDREAASALYRAVVEALTNVRKHARDAQQVRVALRSGPDAGQVELSITDDAPPRPRPGSAQAGLGLASLSTRIRALGGTFRAEPGEDGGWRLCVTVPVEAPVPTDSRNRAR